MSDLYLIAAGKVASERGQSEGVKRFGQLMVEAHGKSLEELKAIVQAEKLGVKLPSRLDLRREEQVEALTQATTEDFDQLYAEQQVRAHNLAVGWFDDYAEEGGNPALKQFAANTLTTLKQHRQQAGKLPQ